MSYKAQEVNRRHIDDDGGKQGIGEEDGLLIRIGGPQHGSLKDVFVPLRDLSMHMVVLGETGFGKTTLITSILTQIWNVKPSLSWLIFDLKGEYLQHLPHISGIVVLKPGLKKTEVYTDPQVRDNFGASYRVTFMPLRIDLLDVGGRGIEDRTKDSVVSRVFTLLKESLASTFKESSELSPLMEKILLKSLSNACIVHRGGRGFIDLLLREVEAYADSEGRGRGRADVVRSCEALGNRVERFRRGYLEDVLNSGEATFTSTLISRRKVIIDLSKCMSQGGTEDLRLLLNILIEKVFEEASRRGLMKGHDVRHITVVEEANLLVPEVFKRKTSGDITPVEEMFLIARGYGEGFILVAQRPTISSFILSNAGTKVIFRTPYDAKKIGEILGMNEIAQSGIRNLQKFEAMTATIEGDVRKVLTPKPRPHSPLQLVPVVVPQPQEKDKPKAALPLPQPLTHPQTMAPTPSPIAKTASPSDQNTVSRLRDGGDNSSSIKLSPRGDDAGKLVGEDDLSRLLKKGLSSDKFRLFRVIATSPQLGISASDAIRTVFQGKKWKYLDAVRSLTNRTYWKNPPLALDKDGEKLRLTVFGAALWKLIFPLLVAVKREQWANL